jgi:hypothetical protein
MSTIPTIIKGASATIEEGKGLLNKLLGPAFDEAGAIIGERMRVFRLQQQVELLRKTSRILDEAGITPKTIKMNVLFPLLDVAALEEDEDMRDRWASLLASAADPGNTAGSEAAFIQILKELTPSDAKILDVFYEQIERHQIPAGQWSEKGIVTQVLRELLTLDAEPFNLAVDNLLRLRLLDNPIGRLNKVNGRDVQFQIIGTGILCATHLGCAFVTACGKGRRRHDGYSVPSDSVTNVFNTDGGLLRVGGRWA